MATIINSFEVKNFSDWQKGFEEGAEIRNKAGVKILGTYRNQGAENSITLIAEFPSIEAAKGFVNSPGLKEAQQKSGVLNQTITFLEKI